MVTEDTTIKGLTDNQHFILALFLLGEYIPVKRRLIDLIFVTDQLFRLQTSEYNCLHVNENLLEVPARYAF
jgi:hypothetical protein